MLSVQKFSRKESPLPLGFPYLVVDDTQEIIEPAFRYLLSRHGGLAKFVKNTAWAEAEDLKDWHVFLGHFGTAWDAVGKSDLERYRDLMITLVSPRTREHYKLSTIKRRLNTVLGFYRWCNGKKLCRVDLEDEIVRVKAPSDRVSLAHTKGRGDRLASSVMPTQSRAPDEEVRALTKEQYLAIGEALGPLPGDAEDKRHTRDRLWAELCVLSGMRPNEPAGLTVADIQNLGDPKGKNPYGVAYLKVVGKGGKARKVEIPYVMVERLRWYISKERAAALKKARKEGWLKKGDEPQALFINSVDSRANQGRPATYATFGAAFLSAVRKVHDTRPELALMLGRTKIDPETKQKSVLPEAAFSPHCLRHTYAIWTYLAEKRAGNAEPWKLLQARLGHAHLSTTTDIYLRLAGDFEAGISDQAQSRVGLILRGDNGED